MFPKPCFSRPCHWVSNGSCPDQIRRRRTLFQSENFTGTLKLKLFGENQCSCAQERSGTAQTPRDTFRRRASARRFRSCGGAPPPGGERARDVDARVFGARLSPRRARASLRRAQEAKPIASDAKRFAEERKRLGALGLRSLARTRPHEDRRVGCVASQCSNGCTRDGGRRKPVKSVPPPTSRNPPPRAAPPF